eukprot:TRINITY_DN3938_c0_g1_i1.p1 TRINITY_DN3938_c0_g1~~TRINITY_DN3938_c0_g1_i1.p1  ORF type:complete len:325 (-),score=98.93 TRINITY_DN3938_c0_g1_i1:16-990(-)
MGLAHLLLATAVNYLFYVLPRMLPFGAGFLILPCVAFAAQCAAAVLGTGWSDLMCLALLAAGYDREATAQSLLLASLISALLRVGAQTALRHLEDATWLDLGAARNAHAAQREDSDRLLRFGTLGLVTGVMVSTVSLLGYKPRVMLAIKLYAGMALAIMGALKLNNQRITGERRKEACMWAGFNKALFGAEYAPTQGLTTTCAPSRIQECCTNALALMLYLTADVMVCTKDHVPLGHSVPRTLAHFSLVPLLLAGQLLAFGAVPVAQLVRNRGRNKSGDTGQSVPLSRTGALLSLLLGAASLLQCSLAATGRWPTFLRRMYGEE